MMRRRQQYDDRAIAVMLEQIRRIDRMVGDLQDVVRIDADILELQREPCQLDAILRETVERAGEQRRPGGIALDLPAVPIAGCWDRDRLGQVFDNLIGNAIKYSPEDAAISVRATVDRAGGTVRVSVTDRGPGIPPEAMARLFDRFYRVTGRHTTGGLGLGLFITRTLVEAHGGEIAAVSELDRGSTFTVELPLAACPEPPAPV
jgi:signal transduction histidine kinase